MPKQHYPNTEIWLPEVLNRSEGGEVHTLDAQADAQTVYCLPRGPEGRKHGF